LQHRSQVEGLHAQNQDILGLLPEPPFRQERSAEPENQSHAAESTELEPDSPGALLRRYGDANRSGRAPSTRHHDSHMVVLP